MKFKKSNKKQTSKKDINDAVVNPLHHELVNAKEFKKYVYGKQFPLLSAQKIKTIWNKNVNKNSVVLVRMYLRIGKYTEFMVKCIKPYFEYNDGLYIIDSNMMVDDLSSGMPTLFYHQDCSQPLAIQPDEKKILKQVLSKAGDVYRNINPIVLKNTVMSDVIQKLLVAAKLEKKFALLLVIGIIHMVITLFMLISIGVFLL